MFDSRDQLEDMRQLWKAIDEMKFPPPCENFPDAFHADQYSSGYISMINMAKSLCAECPIKAHCAEYGVRWEMDGIWGGISPRERQELRAELRRQGKFLPDLNVTAS